MALPISRSFPSLSEMTSPSAGLPKTFSTSPENTQSCPCRIRALGLTTNPATERNVESLLPRVQQPLQFDVGRWTLDVGRFLHDLARASWHSQTSLRQSSRSLRSWRHAPLRGHRSSLRLRRHPARSDSAKRRGPESDF